MPRRPSGQASTMPATSAPAGEPGPLTEAGGTATPMRGRFRPPPRGDARSKQEATRLPAQAGVRADGHGRGCVRLVAVASRASAQCSMTAVVSIHRCGAAPEWRALQARFTGFPFNSIPSCE